MSLSRMFARTMNMSLTASLVILLVLGARLILRKAPFLRPLGRRPVPPSLPGVPAVVFYGTIDYCDPETGEVVTGSGNPYGTRTQSLVVINAVDGSIY